MLKELQYPFNSDEILKKKKKLKRELVSDCGIKRIEKRIAILGGSTTDEIKNILELFLLNYGITPLFYQSEYNQFYQDAVFDNPELRNFKPDIIYIHTTSRNIKRFPSIEDSKEFIDSLYQSTFEYYSSMWESLFEKYKCPVIQNNFEQPFYRIMGNKDVSDIHGAGNFISVMNSKFYEYAQTHSNFYIADINYMASCYGLQKWADPKYWHMYKYALCLSAIPELAFNLANIIKSIYGKNKKTIVLDLDNTLWGGVVGDDGAENIEIGQETSVGQVYSEFQSYIKQHKSLGVLLAVNSKNDEQNALDGLSRKDCILHPEDFIVIKANWNPKDINICEIADTLNLGTDSFVFVDDNPAERHIVSSSVPNVSVPEIIEPEDYIITLDRNGYFEVTNFSEDDIKRNEMYKANAERAELSSKFSDYGEYLESLQMKAEIKPFSAMYFSRIAQLTNKSNQFNLTTLRCSQADIEKMSDDSNYITLYGRLEDKFGDNGIVALVAGHIDSGDSTVFHIDLWLMSCRVLKRTMENSMMDALVMQCRNKNISTIKGYYYPTAKNAMVSDFFDTQGFERISVDSEGNSVWCMNEKDYNNINNYIIVED